MAIAVPSTVTLAGHDRDIASRDIVQARAGFLPQSAFDSAYVYNSPSQQDRSTFSFTSANGIRQFVALASPARTP